MQSIVGCTDLWLGSLRVLFWVVRIEYQRFLTFSPLETAFNQSNMIHIELIKDIRDGTYNLPHNLLSLRFLSLYVVCLLLHN